MSSLDILFISPYKNIRGEHLLNYSMLWIASYLHRHGKSVRVIDMNFGDLEGNHEKIRDYLRRYRPRVVAVSGRWWDSWYGTCEAARVVKEYDPSIRLVTGGEQASHFAVDVCRSTAFDVVIRGKAERPLLQLLQDEEPANAVIKHNGSLRSTPLGYFHTQEELDAARLSPLAEIMEDVDSELDAAPYIWLGDGCPYNCLYCTQASSAQAASPNGPGKVRYRPAESVLSDMDEIARYRDVFFFDFQPTRSPVLEEITRSTAKGRFGIIWEPWNIRLMDTSFVDLMAQTFTFVKFVLDPQVFGHSLRKKLAAQRFVKPYVSDEQLETLLQRISGAGNALFDLSGAYGLPLEEMADVNEGEAYRVSLIDRFPAFEYSFVVPIMVEPGSPLSLRPEAYSLALGRNSYAEYHAHSRDRVFACERSWSQSIADAVESYAREPNEAAAQAFNEHCGVHFVDDPHRVIRHMAAAAGNPTSSKILRKKPYGTNEIARSADGNTVQYRLAGNGRELLNFALVADEILTMKAAGQLFEVDLTGCGWLPSLSRTVVAPPSAYSYSHMAASPKIGSLLEEMDRGGVNVRVRTGPVPETSFLAPYARQLAAERVLG